MAYARLMEHIWQTIESVQYADVNGDTGNRAGLPWYESSHDCFMQDLFGWLDVLTEEVGLTPVYVDTDNATPWHVQFSFMLPPDDMTWEEIEEEPSMLTEANGCQRLYVDVYPYFCAYEVVVRRNKVEVGEEAEGDEIWEISDRFADALNTHFDAEEQL